MARPLSYKTKPTPTHGTQSRFRSGQGYCVIRFSFSISISPSLPWLRHLRICGFCWDWDWLAYCWWPESLRKPSEKILAHSSNVFSFSLRPSPLLPKLLIPSPTSPSPSQTCKNPLPAPFFFDVWFQRKWILWENQRALLFIFEFLLREFFFLIFN